MKLNTALFGFGQIAQGYSDDAALSKTIKFATHAQVLKAHPSFFLSTVVEPREDLRKLAAAKWAVDCVAGDAHSIKNANAIEVAVLATPPSARIQILNQLPKIKAVMVEKPLAEDISAGKQFLELCRRRNILVQVNITRRADSFTRLLANGELEKLVGGVQLATCVYGNGLRNNGTHMIDLVRMLLGDIVAVRAVLDRPAFAEGPLANDLNFPVLLTLSRQLVVLMQPIRFSHYRENCLEIWGTHGKLRYMHGGATLLAHRVGASRLSEHEHELIEDDATIIPSSISDALYQMYSNLADAVFQDRQLLSTGHSALVTTQVVESAFRSLGQGGTSIEIDGADRESN